MTDLSAAIDAARGAFASFVSRCASGDTTYRLTPSAEPSPYARCFGVYCHHLAGITLPAKTLLSTGAITGVHAVTIGQTCLADFGSLGQLRCRTVQAQPS